MITKKAVEKGERVKVTFTLPAGSGRVSVAGDFNEWDKAGLKLRKRGEIRSVSVKLDPGQRYAFRYVDEAGQWFNEDHADAYEYNEFGETNCIIDLRG
jgi:1,4-alpha-glucan branching enzyme